MAAIYDILNYLIQTLLSLYLIAMLLRFLLQVVRADFYNPISQFLVKVTNPLVVPMRRVIPGYAGLDLASLFLAFALQLLAIVLLVVLKYGGLPGPQVLVIGGVLGLVSLTVKVYFFAILAMIILSWIAQGSHHPAIYLLYQLTEPVMAPFRRLLPAMGGMDFSPILVFVLINVIQIALQHMTAAAGVRGLAPWL